MNKKERYIVADIIVEARRAGMNLDDEVAALCKSDKKFRDALEISEIVIDLSNARYALHDYMFGREMTNKFGDGWSLLPRKLTEKFSRKLHDRLTKAIIECESFKRLINTDEYYGAPARFLFGDKHPDWFDLVYFDS